MMVSGGRKASQLRHNFRVATYPTCRLPEVQGVLLDPPVSSIFIHTVARFRTLLR